MFIADNGADFITGKITVGAIVIVDVAQGHFLYEGDIHAPVNDEMD